ncbi:MAG: hypothetical protein GF350_04275 [Chitinivibrionales bacterium]|nr:hypothetical protein [Chitinivibrionales bacterium]
MCKKKHSISILLLISLSAYPACAGESTTISQDHGNMLWTLIAAVLVFFMQAGFAMVESGFTRAKTSVNIMMKNLMDFYS